jgi:tetratricopeptide (TPR) repeat protein
MTGDHHPDPLLLERFMRNETDARERRAIIRHLLAGCPRCTAVTGRLWSFGEARPDLSAYGQVGDLQEAEAPLDRAGMLEMEARGLAQQDRLDDLEKAECLLGRALALYRALGERHREGRVLILAAAVGHRLALLLAETGRGQDALAPLRRARSLYTRLEDGPNLARLRHLEGVIAAGLGSPAEAEAAFREGMRELLLAGLGTEAARALLDLALLYTRQGRSGDLQRLAEELYPILRVRGVGLSVVTSLLFFRRLVETGYATPEVVFQVARFLSDPKAQRPALW